MIHIQNINQFNELLKNENVIVDFFATWCGPCRMIAPLLEEIDEDYPEISIGKVDVDDLSELAAHYSIASIPTLMFIKNGKIVYEQVGFVPKNNLERLIKTYLK